MSKIGKIEMCDTDGACKGKQTTPKCEFVLKIATALEDIQRAAYEHRMIVEIDIQKDFFITIRFKEKERQ